MAIGMPTIASAVGGLLEMIESGRSGVLVPPDNPGSLADEISRLMADPTTAARMGAAARARAQTFSFARMVAAFESVYLTARRRGVSPAIDSWTASQTDAA